MERIVVDNDRPSNLCGTPLYYGSNQLH